MINIYDFDDTIYDGDSSIDFFKYSIKKNKKVLLTIPSILFAFVLYMLKIKEKEYFKSKFFSFVKYFDNIEKVVDDFWKGNYYKIKEFYIKCHKDTDIIISASPEFLLKPVSKKYKFKLVGSKVNVKTGKFEKNCYGEEKVKRLNKLGYKNCNKFYSDSLSDLPLKNISKEAYIVKGNNIINWVDYKESKKKKIIKLFLDRDFFVFLFIGVINVFNGVVISLLYSNIFDDITSYILGFITSMTISYVLNSFLNFKESLTLHKYYKFTISNIPNFIIQLISLLLLLKGINIPKVISYFVSACIAVPITYVLVKVNVFRKENL